MPRQPKEKMPPVPSGMKFDELMRRVVLVKPEKKNGEGGQKTTQSGKRNKPSKGANE